MTHENTSERLLRRKEVEKRIGKSRSAIYAAIAKGTFPAPVPIGEKSVAWLESEINEWIEARVKSRASKCNKEDE